MAYNIMVQGTMSNAGKSLLCAALCRIFRQDGLRAAPFKSQNMALNSFITASGGEMGRAQVVQAEAAGIAPDVRMNPILLKPTTDVGSQVIVNGQVLGNMRAMEYYAKKREFLPDVMRAYESLAAENDVIVIEGAGSPTEINLKQDDFVNMGLAKLVDAPLVKVEATKFTEVGYVGRDVDSMVRDLVETSLRLVKERMGKDVEIVAEQNAQERILDALVDKEKGEKKADVNPIEALLGPVRKPDEPPEVRENRKKQRERLRMELMCGSLEGEIIEIEVEDTATTDTLPGTRRCVRRADAQEKEDPQGVRHRGAQDPQAGRDQQAHRGIRGADTQDRARAGAAGDDPADCDDSR